MIQGSLYNDAKGCLKPDPKPANFRDFGCRVGSSEYGGLQKRFMVEEFRIGALRFRLGAALRLGEEVKLELLRSYVCPGV